MLPTAISSNTSLVALYTSSGQPLSLQLSELTQRSRGASESANIRNNEDTVTLSESGLEQSRQSGNMDNGRSDSSETPATDTEQQETTKGQTGAGGRKLSLPEEKEVQQLKARDREVKAHELAHLAAAGQYVRGGPSYSYQRGPDGQMYAIGGEVPVDISKETTPEQTIQKMEIIKRAAMAPTEPSSADRGIAAAAAVLEAQARQEMQAVQKRAFQEQQEMGINSQATGEKSPDADAVASSSIRSQPLDSVVV